MDNISKFQKSKIQNKFIIKENIKASMITLYIIELDTVNCPARLAKNKQPSVLD